MGMPHGKILVHSISNALNPTTEAPSAGPNGELGRLALENEVVKSINLVDPSGGNVTIIIDDYVMTNPSPGVIRFTQIVPLSVNLNGGGTYEVGQTVNSVNLTWSYNNGNPDPDTSQTLNQGIGSVPLNDRSYVYNTPITASGLSTVSFSITGVDSIRGSDSDSTNVRFGLRVYSGITTNSVMTAADITGGSSQIRTSANPDYDDTYDCTGGNYFWYAYPASWGLLSASNTKVNGLSFSAWSDNAGGQDAEGFTLNVTNAYGHTELYRVYRVFNLQNGSNIPVQYRN